MLHKDRILSSVLIKTMDWVALPRLLTEEVICRVGRSRRQGATIHSEAAIYRHGHLTTVLSHGKGVRCGCHARVPPCSGAVLGLGHVLVFLDDHVDSWASDFVARVDRGSEDAL